jgi:hypothetical protein
VVTTFVCLSSLIIGARRLLGSKRTIAVCSFMSASDPKRTFRGPDYWLAYAKPGGAVDHHALLTEDSEVVALDLGMPGSRLLREGSAS